MTTLQTCAKLQPTVDVKSIVVSMLDRLANFAAQEPTNFPREIDVFMIFSSAITNIIEVLIATYELPTYCEWPGP